MLRFFVPAASDLVPKRIPALDGWRGIAILLVLADHIQFAILGRYPTPWAETGQHGVTLFFVLSGYLITSKLLERPIDLRRFYIRRFFRLMPVAWTYLAVLLLLTATTGVPFTSHEEVRACLLFYRNFVGHTTGGGAGHFWSLSLEEQFYLVWPCVLLFGRRRARWFAIIGTLAVASYRWLRWAHYDHNLIDYHSEVRADALLVGCLLAIVLYDHRPKLYRWFLPSLAVFLYGVARCHRLVPLYECVAIAVLIGATVLHTDSLPARILSVKPLTYLGLISYSIYVWQELFMRWRGEAGIVTVFVIMPTFAICSYYLIERPCMRFARSPSIRRQADPVHALP